MPADPAHSKCHCVPPLSMPWSILAAHQSNAILSSCFIVANWSHVHPPPHIDGRFGLAEASEINIASISVVSSQHNVEP